MPFLVSGVLSDTPDQTLLCIIGILLVVSNVHCASDTCCKCLSLAVNLTALRLDVCPAAGLALLLPFFFLHQSSLRSRLQLTKQADKV